MFVLKDPIRGVINYLIKGTKINGDFENPLEKWWYPPNPLQLNIQPEIADGKNLIY